MLPAVFTIWLLLGCASAFPIWVNKIAQSLPLVRRDTDNHRLNLTLAFPVSPPPPSVENQTSSYSIPNYETYDPANWVLTTTELRNNTYDIQPYSANGYIGVRIPVQGQGLSFDHDKKETNGWPLFDRRFSGAYLAGFWDLQPNLTAVNFPELLKKGGESVLSTIPQWTQFELKDLKTGSAFNNATDNSTGAITHWSQSLSLRNGVVQTNISWTPSADSNHTMLANSSLLSAVSYNISYTVITHRNRPNLGMVRVDITPNATTQVTLSDLLNFDGSMRTSLVGIGNHKDHNAISSAVRPRGIHNVTAFEYSQVELLGDLHNATRCFSRDKTTPKQTFFLNNLMANQTYSVIKYVGIASSDAYPRPRKVAKYVANHAAKTGYSKLVEEHVASWDKLWVQGGEIQIPGDTELQLSARASIFNLLANTRKGEEGYALGDNSVGVGGLSSDSYAGMIFWDADMWMFPGLQALFPDLAASIINYRYRMFDQARLNARSYNNSTGAVYPWTSARFGNCTATGPCFDYEYHINVDVSYAQWQYFLTTFDTNWLRQYGYPIIKDTADYMASYVTRNASTNNLYQTFNLTDPDEFANHVNNGAFTNAGIIELMGYATEASGVLGVEANPKWQQVAGAMYIPENSTLDLTLEYDHMNGTAAIKQADVVMLTYPLQYNQSDERARRNLEYYAYRQDPNGPAMTYAIYTIDEAQLATEGCATYTYLLNANQPYLRRPWYQFSEQTLNDPTRNGGTNPAFPFLTGAGGYLQTYTHGFTGYRPQLEGLYLDPVLPPQLAQGYVVKGLKFRGGVFDVNVTLHNTTITRREDFIPDPVRWMTPMNSSSVHKNISIIIGNRNEKAGTYHLAVNKTLSIPTYRTDLNSSNIAQCKPALSLDPWVPGQFPIAINDGNNATRWQPDTTNKSTVTIDLGDSLNFSSVHFVWGPSPPKKVSFGRLILADESQDVTNATAKATPVKGSSLAGVAFTQTLALNLTTALPSIITQPANNTVQGPLYTYVPEFNASNVTDYVNTWVTQSSQAITTTSSSEPTPTASVGYMMAKRGEEESTRSSRSSVSELQWILADEEVTPSEPYNPKMANASWVFWPSANETSFELGAHYDARFLVVAIEGSFDSNSTGGTLAEVIVN